MFDHTPIQLSLPFDDEIIQLPLSKGYIAVISAIDADLSESKWSASERKGLCYAIRQGIKGNEYLHRVILQRVVGGEIIDGKRVDHINHDSLDNRRGNLRLATPSQNGQNQRLQSNTNTGYKGIVRDGRLWYAQIKLNQEWSFLGMYNSAVDAAIAYNYAARERFGEFATFNDIPNWENCHPVRRKRNSDPSTRNTSGYVGVSFHKPVGKWMAYFNRNHKRILVGYFDTKEQAHEAREASLKKLLAGKVSVEAAG